MELGRWSFFAVSFTLVAPAAGIVCGERVCVQWGTVRVQAPCRLGGWNRKEELTAFCKGIQCMVVRGVISLPISCILIWFAHYFLGFFGSAAIFNFPLNSWIHYLANVLQLECPFLVTFFPKIIIRLKFLALASCPLSSLCISSSSPLSSSAGDQAAPPPCRFSCLPHLRGPEVGEGGGMPWKRKLKEGNSWHEVHEHPWHVLCCGLSLLFLRGLSALTGVSFGGSLLPAVLFQGCCCVA